MSILIYGGAFDPLHNGHVEIIEYLLTLNGFDQICLVPTGTPVFKSHLLFSAEQRLSMLKLLYGDQTKIVISDYEIKKKEPSFFIDTMNYFLQRFQSKRCAIVVGFDQFQQFHKWFKYSEILSQSELFIIPRKGFSYKNFLSTFPHELLAFKDRCHLQDIVPFDISSSQIRDTLKNNGSINDVVPYKVLSLIRSLGVH